VPGHRRGPCRWHQGAGGDHRRLPGVDRVVGYLLRDLKRRAMRAPVLAVGDGALGFWGARREVFPETRTQRCWVHKVDNVINALPTSVQPTARRMLAEIRDAEDRAHAVTAINAFASEFGAKWPKAVAKVVDDVEPLLRLLRLPGRALDPPQDNEPDRVDILHGSAAHQGDQRPRLAGSRAGDGVQAHRRGGAPLAGRQRAAPRRPRPRRSTIRQGGDRRTPTAGSGSRRVNNNKTRSTGLDDSSATRPARRWPAHSAPPTSSKPVATKRPPSSSSSPPGSVSTRRWSALAPPSR
jgi:putative transposase